jgi:hypothetical protein
VGRSKRTIVRDWRNESSFSTAISTQSRLSDIRRYRRDRVPRQLHARISMRVRKSGETRLQSRVCRGGGERVDISPERAIASDIAAPPLSIRGSDPTRRENTTRWNHKSAKVFPWRVGGREGGGQRNGRRIGTRLRARRESAARESSKLELAAFPAAIRS